MSTTKDLWKPKRGVVLIDGHIDRITGPRCILKMLEGEFIGCHIIAHTDSVLPEGTRVLFCEITKRAKPEQQVKSSSEVE